MQKLKYLIALFVFPSLAFSQNHFVQNEGQIILQEGFMVLENSHFTNNATFVSTNGTVKLTGDALDTDNQIGGTNTTNFHNLTINKLANNVQLAQHIKVEGQLTLGGGLLDLQDFDMELGSSLHPIIGATDSRYLQTSGQGHLKMKVSSQEMVFPVGNEHYNPVKITNAGTSDLIGVRVEDEVLSNLTSGDKIMESSVNRVWHINEAIDGNSNLNINLEWKENAELLHFNRSQSTFAAFENGEWMGKNTGAATESEAFNFTGSNISKLGGFTIANSVCQGMNPVVLGVLPPIAGQDQLNICGTTVSLAGTSSAGAAGIWSVVNSQPTASATIGQSTNVMSSLTGVFGGLYSLRWTVTKGVCNGVFDEVLVSFNPDEDLPGGLPDGVQDCMDICLGGNDLVNTDGFGAPDDCDCFPTEETNEFVEFNTSELLPLIEDVLELDLDTAKRTVDFELSSATSIEAKQTDIYPTVLFQAENNIILEPGFHAKAGSDFLAIIESCRNPLSGEINEVDSPPEAKVTLRNQLALPISNTRYKTELSIQPTIINTNAEITLQLPIDQSVTLRLLHQNGHQIRTFLNNSYREKGVFNFTFNAQNLVNGLYYLQLQSGTDLITKKLIVLK